MINTAILTAVIDRGPTVISMPGDVAASDAPYRVHEVAIPVAPVFRPADADMEKLAAMIEAAKRVAIRGFICAFTALAPALSHGSGLHPESRQAGAVRPHGLGHKDHRTQRSSGLSGRPTRYYFVVLAGYSVCSAERSASITG